VYILPVWWFINTSGIITFKELHMTKRIVLPMLLLMLAGMFVVGCEKDSDTTVKDKLLCGGCGQIKGTDTCCKPDAVKCEKCGLDKGSPGCCKITKGKDIALCGKCGLVKGSDLCCKADAIMCDKCGKPKGSPGCCK
jgi:hypothetical protein